MHKPLLIVIDDEEDILDLLEYNLTRRGYTVKVFERAQAALAFMQEQIPAAILCDWMMPGMNGLETCKQLKAMPHLAHVPFMMITCKTDSRSIQQALKAGAAAFISKPVLMNELVAHVRQILKKRNSPPSPHSPMPRASS